MAGHLLTTLTTMLCPHGGKVQAVSSNTKVSAGSGAYVLRISDTFIIAGCTFVPNPCVRVQWIVADMRVKVDQQPTLSEGSVGLCLSALQAPQGKVIVVNTQMKASSQ
jgi:hypothetical protein